NGLLKKLDVVATIVSDGSQAFDAYKAQHTNIDLVLMDCEMPDTDGFTATRMIREWEKQQQLPAKPIVALTAHAMQEYQQRCIEAGMDAHMAKPIQLALLRDIFALYLKD
ncbi:MAG TPA: response regulator, partial [Pseudomonadales bacterium]|nr:response regulator [Pseudomonadales bacterium]